MEAVKPMERWKWIRYLVAGIAAMALAPAVHAQWTAVSLSPGIVSSGDQLNEFHQSGAVRPGAVSLASGSDHAALWSGSPGSWVDLHPAGATISYVLAMDGDMQGGGAIFSSVTHAALWTGTAASWTDLHPTGASYSQILGMAGGQQVGRARFGTVMHAGLWSGNAASFVDLHPAGVPGTSIAYATDGVNQGGSLGPHATMWSGTAASGVDMHASWMGASSIINAIDGGQQAGYARVPDPSTPSGDRIDAVLWNGTPESAVSLQPAGVGTPFCIPPSFTQCTASMAFAAYGGKQVGRMYFSDARLQHAVIWSGTPESWEDLSDYLPASYSGSSDARDVWTDGCALRVIGGAFTWAGLPPPPAPPRREAILWVHSFPWSNFLPPINPDGSSSFRQGSTVPVKFRLVDECVAYSKLQARLYVAPVVGGVPGPESPAEPAGGANTGNLFRYSSLDDTYIFNLSTRDMGVGTWQLRVDLGDYTTRTAIITLR